MNLKFEEKTHTYFVDGKKIDYSVTKFIHKFFSEFKSNEIAELCHNKGKRELIYKYKNYSSNQIKQIWSNVSKYSTNFGTFIHKYAECMLNGLNDYPIPQNKEELEFIEIVQRRCLEILEEYEVIATEKLLYSSKFNIAGSCDLILKNKKTKQIEIRDWKTNRKDLFDSEEYCFDPISHLKSTSYNKYWFQLHLYKIFYQMQENYKEDIKCSIEHLGFGTIELDSNLLKNELKEILKYRLRELND